MQILAATYTRIHNGEVTRPNAYRVNSGRILQSPGGLGFFVFRSFTSRRFDEERKSPVRFFQEGPGRLRERFTEVRSQMKTPWKSSGSDAATAVAEPAVDELVPLQQRRGKLVDLRNDIAAKISGATSARQTQLLAGDDVAGSVGVADLRDELDVVAGVISQIDAQIGSIQERRAKAAAIVAQQKLQADFVAARQRAETARSASHRALRRFIFIEFRELMRAQRAAAEDARQAAKRIGQDYGLDTFLPTFQAEIGIRLEAIGRDLEHATLYGPE